MVLGSALPTSETGEEREAWKRRGLVLEERGDT